MPRSVGFKTYLLARAADLPAIELEHQVTPTPVTVLGAKGVGEAGFSGAQAALLGAVNDALRPLGARIDRTPVSPPNVLRRDLRGPRVIAERFEYRRPGDVGEAVSMLADDPGGARVLGGGTWLIPEMTRGETRPRIVVDLAAAGLAAIDARG